RHEWDRLRADAHAGAVNVMPGTMGTVLLWLFVLNLGIAFGAGLYEHRINIPRWLTDTGAPHWNAGAAQQDDVGRRFWVLVTTIPSTLLTIANLLAAWPREG